MVSLAFETALLRWADPGGKPSEVGVLAQNVSVSGHTSDHVVVEISRLIAPEPVMTVFSRHTTRGWWVWVTAGDRTICLVDWYHYPWGGVVAATDMVIAEGCRARAAGPATDKMCKMSAITQSRRTGGGDADRRNVHG
jgi:hypothetical protein